MRVFDWKHCVFLLPVLFFQLYKAVELEDSYHGCYEDNPDLREGRVSGGSYDINQLTPMQCLGLCKKKDYQYAALLKGYLCLCSLDGGSYGDSDETQCDNLCVGSPTHVCGTDGFSTVYSTSTSVKNFQIEDPGFIEVYKETTLEISLEAGSEGTVYRFDFGDATLIGDEYDSPEPHIFMETGMFLVIATARNNASGPIEARREVYVEMPISDVGTRCNPFIEVDHVFECVSWAGQGTAVQITWNFNDDSPTTEFKIADAQRFSVGPTVPRRLSKPLQPLLPESMGHVGVFILPAYEFKQFGKVEAWEVYAVKEGQVKLQIYRPICGEEEKYCAFNRSCMSKYLPCPPVSEMACSNGTTFCVRNVTCAPITTFHYRKKLNDTYKLIECNNVTALALGVDHINGTWCNVSVPYASMYDYDYGECTDPEVLAEMLLGYKLAGETIVYLDPGYNLFTLDVSSRLKVRPHDLIGYIPYDEILPWYYPKAAYPPIGEIAQVANSTASQSVFFINQSHIYVRDRLNPIHNQVQYSIAEFYIRAVMSKKTSSWMSHSYSNSEMFEVSVEYNNPLGNPVQAVSYWVASQYRVLSIQGMDFTRDLGLYYACTDVPYEMHVEVTQGTFARFVWTFPDGSTIQSAPYLEIEEFQDDADVKIPDKQSYHFDVIGNYSTHVRVYNNISEVEITLYTVARERITGLNGSFVLYPGDNTTKDWNLVLAGCWFNFSSTILTGNEVVYKWAYGDGDASGDWSFDVLYEHYYTEPGTYTVEINSDNIASVLDHSFEVTAVKPNNVHLPEYGTSEIPVRMFCDVTWHSGQGLEFEWDFGDGESEITYDSGVMYHNYTTFNTYEVQCVVKNYPEVSDTNSIIIQDPVEGVELVNITEVLATTDSVDFGVVWTRGNDVHFVWYFGDGVDLYTDDPAATHVYEQIGYFDVTVNVSNVVSWMMSPPMTVEVQERITNALVESHNSPIDVYVEIRVSTATGNKILYDYDFGDGFNTTNSELAVFGHSYAHPDTFTITARAHNDVSEQTAQTFTQIDSLIGDAGLYAVSPHTRQETLEAQCVAFNGSNVAMTFDWGDGTTSGPYDATYTGRKSFFTGTHGYDTEGSYRIKCFMQNPFSDAVARTTVTVQNRITDVTFIPDVRVKGEMFQFTVNPFSGGTHNVSFSWNYGDGIHYDTFQFTHDYVYKDAGSYKVNLVTRNLVSEFTTIQDFFVQESVEKLEFVQEVFAVEPGTPTLFVWMITHGTDVVYTLDTGDGSEPFEYLQADMGMYVSVEYIFPWPGSFTVTVTAANKLNSLTITDVAHVEYPVRGLQVYVRGNSTTHTDKSAFVMMYIDQGTNVVYECDYQDGSRPVVTTHPMCKHAFIALGSHLVTVKASNHLSSVRAVANEPFLVLLPPVPHRIRGLHINVSDATAFGKPTVFLLTRERGNRRFNCTLKFGDGNQTLVDNSYFMGTEIEYTYSEALIYTAELNCTNFYHDYVQGYTEVVIQHPIVQLNITDGLFGEFGFNLTVNFTVLIGTDIDGLVEFDGNAVPTYITGMGGYAVVDSSYFNDTGYFNVTVTVWNLVTQPLSKTEQAYIESRITNMRLWGDRPLSPVGAVITFCVSMTAGSSVSFDWTLGTNYRVYSTRNATKWREKDCKQHLFTEVGIYAVFVVASNLLSVETHEPITVVIQHEVKGFTFITDSPVVYPTGNISFILDRDPIFTIPTNASVEITFGDDTPSINIPLPDIVDSLPYSFTHQYEPGIYPFELVVSNIVSKQAFPISVETQIPIQDCNITGYNTKRPGVESGTRGGGPDNTYFPVEYPVSFRARHRQGTGVVYTWLYGDRVVDRNVGSMVTHKYSIAKNYLVIVIARNLFSETSCETKMHFQESVLGLYLAHSGPTEVNQPMTAVLFAVQVGTNPVYILEVSNGTRNNSVELAPLSNDPVLIRSALQMIHPSFYIPSDPYSLFVTTARLVFSDRGDYPITAIGYNSVSEMRVTRVAHVTYEHCEPPTIELYGGSKNISEPWQVKRSVQASIITHVGVNCTNTTVAIYEWEVYVVTYHRGKPLPANQLYQYENLPSSVTLNEANIVIPRRSLEYGMYLIQLTVTMDNEGKVSNANQVYLEIEPSLLVVSIFGGSSMVVGVNDTITLDASASYDPDDEPPSRHLPTHIHHGLSHQWYCRLPHELFAFEDPGNSSVVPGDGVGCFDEGPGLFAENVTVLHFNASEFITQQEIVFAVKVSKLNSDVYREPQLAFQKVTIWDSVPPNLDIRCIQNCGNKMNPSKRLALVVECQTCETDSISEIAYNWTFSHKGKQISEWEHITSTGIQSSYLVIKADTLLEYSGHIITLQVSGDWLMSSVSGVVQYTFTVSPIPAKGNCDVSPRIGRALDTKFVITCQGFDSEEKPIFYEYYYGTRDPASQDVMSYQLVYYSPDSVTPELSLPMGKADSDYMVNVRVDAIDAIGAKVSAHLQVQVLPPTVDNLESELNSFKQGRASELDALLNKQDVQAAVQYVSALTTALNNEDTASKDSQLVSETPLTEEELQQKAAIRKQVRSTLVDKIAEVKVRDLKIMKEASSALSQVIEKDLPVDAQLTAGVTYGSMTNILKEQRDEETTPEDIEDAARYLFTGVSKLIKAASDDASEFFTELASDSTAWNDFMAARQVALLQLLPTIAVPTPTSDIMLRPGVENITVDPDIAVVRDEILTEDEDSLPSELRNSRAITKQVFSVLDDLSNIILSQKLPGESPVEIDTGTILMVLQREFTTTSADRSYQIEDGTWVKIPNSVLESVDENVVDIQIYSTALNPFTWHSSGYQVKTSVVGLTLKHTDGDVMSIRDMTDDIEMFIPRSEDGSLDVEMLTTITDSNVMVLFNLTESYTSIHIEIHPSNTSVAMDAFLRFGFPPSPDQYDLKMRLPLSEESLSTSVYNETYNMTADPYVWFIEEHVLHGVGSYYLSVQPAGRNRDILSIMNSTDGGSSVDFDVKIFTARCLYWSDMFEQWFPSGCKVGGLTTSAYTHCHCNHLSAFGGSFYIPANQLVTFEYVIIETALDQSPILAAVVGAIVALYIATAVVACVADVKHQKKFNPETKDKKGKLDSSYRYIITVFTSINHGAGTTSKVSVQLMGSKFRSKVINLSNEGQHEFQDGSIDTFLIDVYTSLGELLYISVWHDGSGFRPEWYLSRVVIEDAQTGKSWYFLCNHIYQGKFTPQTYKALTFDEAVLNKHLFSVTTLSDLCSSHLTILGFLVRKVKSTLTRLENLTCLFAFVFFTMLVTSVLLYGDTQDYAQQPGGGEFKFSAEAITNGVLGGVIALPINWLFAFLFRRSRRIELWSKRAYKDEKSKVKRQESLQEVKVEGGYSEEPEQLDKSGVVVPDINVTESLWDDDVSGEKEATKDAKSDSSNEWRSDEGEVEIASESFVKGDSAIAEPEGVTLKIPEEQSRKARDGHRHRKPNALKAPVSGDERLTQRRRSRQGMKKSHSLVSGHLHSDEDEHMAREKHGATLQVPGIGVGASRSGHRREGRKSSSRHRHDRSGSSRSHHRSSSRHKHGSSRSTHRSHSHHRSSSRHRRSRHSSSEERGHGHSHRKSRRDLHDESRHHHRRGRSRHTDSSSPSHHRRHHRKESTDGGSASKHRSRHRDSDGGRHSSHHRRHRHHHHRSHSRSSEDSDVDNGKRSRRHHHHHRRHRRHSSGRRHHHHRHHHHRHHRRTPRHHHHHRRSSRDAGKMRRRQWPRGKAGPSFLMRLSSAASLTLQGWLLPWWTRIITWLSFVIIMIGAMFLTTWYGLYYSQPLAFNWIISVLTAVFSLLFVIEPVFVFAAAVVFIAFNKRRSLKEESVIFEAQYHQPSLDKHAPVHDMESDFGVVEARSLRSAPQRKEEMRPRKWLRISSRWTGTVLFFVLAVLIAYTQKDSSAYYMRQSLYHSVVNGTALGDKSQPFEKIQTASEYWAWSKSVLLPSLYSMDSEDTNYQSVLIGTPRLRQLRVNASDGECEHDTVDDYTTMICDTGYSAEIEDKTQYLWGWEPIPEDYNLEQTKGYRYYPALSLGEDGDFPGKFAVYGGGGYVADLTRVYSDALSLVQDLEEAAWIDKYTRAVFMECAVFNAQSRLVYVVTLLAEIAPTGNFFTSVELKLLTMYSQDSGVLEMILVVALAVTVLVMVCLKLRRAMEKGHRYFKDFSQVVDALCIVVSLTAVAVHFYYGMIVQEAKAQSRNVYTLRNCSYMQDQLHIILAVLVFCALLKVLITLSTFSHFKLLLLVCKASVKQVLKSAPMFVFIFVTFVHTGFMVYSETEEELHTVGSTVQTLLFYPLGGSRQMDPKGTGVRSFFTLYLILLGIMIYAVFYVVTMHTYSSAKLHIPLEDFADTGEMSAACKKYVKKLAWWRRIGRMRARMEEQMRRMRHRRNQLMMPSPLPVLERHSRWLDRTLRNIRQENQLLFQNLGAVQEEMRRQIFSKR